MSSKASSVNGSVQDFGAEEEEQYTLPSLAVLHRRVTSRLKQAQRRRLEGCVPQSRGWRAVQQLLPRRFWPHYWLTRAPQTSPVQAQRPAEGGRAPDD